MIRCGCRGIADIMLHLAGEFWVRDSTVYVFKNTAEGKMNHEALMSSAYSNQENKILMYI